MAKAAGQQQRGKRQRTAPALTAAVGKARVVVLAMAVARSWRLQRGGARHMGGVGGRDPTPTHRSPTGVASSEKCRIAPTGSRLAASLSGATPGTHALPRNGRWARWVRGPGAAQPRRPPGAPAFPCCKGPPPILHRRALAATPAVTHEAGARKNGTHTVTSLLEGTLTSGWPWIR